MSFPPHRSSFTARRIALAMILALVALCGLQLRHDYQTAEAQGERLVAAMVNAIAQQVGGSIRAVDGLLEETAAGAARWGQADFSDHLATRLAEFPEVRFVALIGADGHFIGDTVPRSDVNLNDVNLADRDYFIHQRNAHGANTVWIGTPVMGRVTGERTVHLSRPIYDAKGLFIGIVLAAVNPDHYANFLDSVLLEPAGGSAVISLSGAILARAPAHAEKFASNIADSDLFTTAIPHAAKGVVRLLSKADSNEKLVGYSVLDHYPLVVTSGLSIHTALTDWRTMAAVEAVLVLVFAVALFYWARQADLRQGRSDDIQQSLEDMVVARTGELEQSRELAEERALRLASVNDELRRLAQVTAHHLQEPVRPIVSYTQMVRRKLGNGDAEITDWLEFVEKGGLRLKALLRDFQRYASILAQEPVRQSIAAEEALTIAMAWLGKQIAETGAVIDHGPLPWVLADRDMLAGVFRQILDNATRHRHPDRMPRVSVRAEDGGAVWVFIIDDNGQGIESGLAAKAFEAFERLGTATAGSTGLGLAICRAVIQAHGGRIWVEPRAEGSSFRFTLPKGEQPTAG